MGSILENYFDTFRKAECNGCGICAKRCPTNAITMVEDEEGFFYPKIDESKCINCGLCKRICSNNPEKNNYDIKVYAAYNKDLEQRLSSTSGGVFKILAEYALSNNGVVFGAMFDENFNVVHDYTETREECQKFSSTKYVRSDLRDSFEKAEKFLKDGRIVLFSGTPCQNYALKKYLREDYSNLILCEIICHSNPSPKIFKMWKEYLEIKYGKIKKYCFRTKNRDVNSPYIEFEDGRIFKDDRFNEVFGAMLISRPSCSHCVFCDKNRKADFTIGDFWGIDNFIDNFNDGKGISLLCINSDKADKIFKEIIKNVEYKESNLNDAFLYNHHSNKPQHKKRNKFFEKVKKGKINNKNIGLHLKYYEVMYKLENKLNKKQ